jgi:hypothetical protein
MLIDMENQTPKATLLLTKIGALSILAFQIAGAAGLWTHTSDEPAVLGRYALDYFALVVAYHLMMVIWAGLAARLILCTSATRLENLRNAVRRFAEHPLLFWGTVVGLWGAMIVFLLLSATRSAPPLARVAPLATLTFASLLLLVLSPYHAPIMAAMGWLVTTIRRFAERPLLFWGTVIGLWGAMIVFLLLSATRSAPPLARVAPLATLTFASLLLLALSPHHAPIMAAMGWLAITVRRFAERPLLFWGTVVGLWGAMIVFLLLSATWSAPPLARASPLAAFTFARLILLTSVACVGEPQMPILPAPDAPWPRLRATIAHLARRDALPLAFFAELTLIYTYPLVLQLGAAVPGYNSDVWPALWEDWWLRKAVLSGTNPTFTTLLFHPTGLDTTFAGRHWTSLPFFVPLAALFGYVPAFNLNSLFGLLACAYFAYLLAFYLARSRLAAWVGGAVFAFWPGHFIAFTGWPNSGHTQWLPLFMLAFVHGLRARKPAYMALAAVALALSSYFNVKVTLISTFVGGLYLLWWIVAERAWHERATWAGLALFVALFLLLVVPVARPFVSNPAYLGYAIDLYQPVQSDSADLLSFFTTAIKRPPLLPPVVARAFGFEGYHFRNLITFYLGLSGIALAILATFDMLRRQRRRLVWPIMAAVFFALSLGPVLYIGRVQYEWVPMPFRLIQHIPIVQALRAPFRFGLAADLAWAILVAFGVDVLLSHTAARPRLRAGLLGGLVILLLFEYLPAPIPTYPLDVSPFYDQIAADDQSYALVDLPMGRGPSKDYLFLQTVHGKPIVEGMVARMPSNAYDYIEAQPLLSAWRAGVPLDCATLDYPLALADLSTQGFRYVILHHGPGSVGQVIQALQSYFAGAEPVYQDQYITVYDLRALQEGPSPCTSRHTQP